jgi:monoamine oxidase
MTRPDDPRGWSRRRFLQMVGMAGGSAAVYETMTALGMINQPTAFAGPPRMRAGAGKGKTVLILGAGIGGLTAAYELMKAGYTVEILEAQGRAGGRSHTARRGSVVEEQSREHGRTEQVCAFDEGLYLNLGPGRLPYHHRRVLHYCRELGVPLEVYVMTTEANLFQTGEAFRGNALLRRRILNDTRGYISEMLAKAVDAKALDAHLDGDDRQKLLSLLQVFGDLGKNTEDPYGYGGSTRSGCVCPEPDDPYGCHASEGELGCDPCDPRSVPPTVCDPCEPSAPLPFKELLQAEFWKHRLYQPVELEWQPTLFQPVGGMDKIVDGFLRKVGHLIEYQSVVQQLTITDEGVAVEYTDHLTGDTCTKRADYCISNIPLPVLKKKVQANFSEDYRSAVDQGRFEPSCKVGWQADERFWENDCNQIYGGISYIDDLVTQVWYPSNDYFSAKGTLTGTYNYTERAERMGRMLPAERLRAARQGGAKLHPELLDERIVPESKGLSVAWQNVPHQEGAWAQWSADSVADRNAYARLLAPDRRFFMVGDQVSTLPGWQEGAMMSAEHVVEQIGGFRALDVPTIEAAPETRALVQGRF